MQHWEHAFAAHEVAIGQVLVTHDDLGDRRRFLSARLTLRALLDHGVVPIINENDTVATEEIKFGDNDQLAALVCNLVSADALVILTDVEGVRDATGVRMPIVRDIDREAAPVAGGSTSGVGSGGMASKVGSARIVTRTGVPAIVAPGREPDVLARVLAGADVGTLFVPATRRCRRASTGSRTARSRPASSSSTTAPRARSATAARACCPPASSRSTATSSSATRWRSSRATAPSSRGVSSPTPPTTCARSRACNRPPSRPRSDTRASTKRSTEMIS